MKDRVDRQLKLLRIYAGLSALAIAWLAYSALSDDGVDEFDRIRVQGTRSGGSPITASSRTTAFPRTAASPSISSSRIRS